MDPQNDITDEEFIPFLQRLGVDTHKKSFEWMLNDPEFGGVLRWLHNNLDHNNALTAREEYRYAEIEKRGELLSIEELEASVQKLQEECEGICLPGIEDAIEDVRMDITMQKERLSMLQKQEEMLHDLIKQNELTKDELDIELAKLNSFLKQSIEDENAAAEECQTLAKEVETITDGVVDVIGDTLNIYGNAVNDKNIAKKFFTFGPIESYRMSQALFRSHFDLYTARKFDKKPNDSTDTDLRSALIEAKSLKDRLYEAICAYIESKAELTGEQGKLALIANYNNVHPSQVKLRSLETQSAISLLEQEETILNQQIQNTAREFVDSRTKLVVESAQRSALFLREQMHKDLTYLLETTKQAVAIDRVLYCAVRQELRTLEELLQFAAHMKQYVVEENEAVCSRIASMNEICSEQESCEKQLQSDNLLQILSTILGNPSNNASSLVKIYSDLKANMKELENNIKDGFEKKENALVKFKESTKPLRDYIWDGCTKQPNCRDRKVSALAHLLKQEMDKVDIRVVEASGLFTSVKKGDKNSLRKLWQWFLTDPSKLLSVVRGVQCRSYS